MRKQSRALAALLFFGTAPAVAGYCTKADYAEVKDWPVAQLERDYCRNKGMVDISLKLQRDKVAAGVYAPNSPGERREAAETAVCVDQAALEGRVLANVHGRPLPACKPLK